MDQKASRITVALCLTGTIRRRAIGWRSGEREDIKIKVAGAAIGDRGRRERRQQHERYATEKQN
jgi:hypothetical protein